MATNLVEGDEAAGEAATKQVFTPYVCRTIDRGIPHPGDVAEAASLAYVDGGVAGGVVLPSLRSAVACA